MWINKVDHMKRLWTIFLLKFWYRWFPRKMMLRLYIDNKTGKIGVEGPVVYSPYMRLNITDKIPGVNPLQAQLRAAHKDESDG